MAERDYTSTILRMAGNIAGGMTPILGTLIAKDPRVSELVAEASVRLALDIFREVQRAQAEIEEIEDDDTR